MFTGTIDLVGTFCGVDILCDHKTSSPRTQTSASIEAFFHEYNMGIQTMFYSWVHNRLNQWPKDKFINVLINGIFTKKTTVAASKQGLFDGVKFQRSKIISYNEEQINFFEGWLLQKVQRIISYLDNPALDMSSEYELSACKGPFSLCKYFSVCQSPTSLQEQVLKAKFSVAQYNPLTFGGGVTPET